MSKIAAIIGRILLALIFIVSGITKLMDIGAAQQMLAAANLPTSFALPVGIFELVAGLCLAIGLAVRLVSLLLIVFVAGTILFYHSQPGQAVEALKNAAIIGGLFLAFAHSQMWSHYYSLRTERKHELEARDANRRVHEAELRAARAEAEAKAAREGTTLAPAAPAPAYVDTNGDGIADRRVTGRRRWFDW